MLKRLFIILFLLPFALIAQKPQLVIKNGLQSKLEMASISTDNKLALTVENNEVLILWELATGKQLQTFPNVMAADFSLDGQSIDIVTNDYAFKTIDYSGKILKQYASPEPGNNKSNRLTMSYYRKSGIFLENGNIYNKEKGYLGRALLNENYGVEQDYSETINLLAIPNQHEVRLCEIPVPKIVKVLKFNLLDNNIYKRNIHFTKFSKNGKYLMAGNDFSLAIIDIASGENIYTFKYMDEKNTDVTLNVASFSSDGNSVLILTTGHFILIDLVNKKEEWRKENKEFKVNEYNLGVVKFADDDKTALIGYGKKLIFIDVESGKIKSTLLGITNTVVEHQQLVDGVNSLFINQGDKLLNWNLNSGALQKVMNIDPTPLIKISKSANKLYQYWQEVDTKTLEKKDFQFQGRVDGTVEVISLSSDNKLLLHVGRYEDKALENPYGINHDKLIVADVLTKKIIWRKNQINIAAFANKSQTIAAINTYAGFNTIQLLNGLTGELIRNLTLPSKMVNAYRLKFSSNDKYLTFFTPDFQVAYELSTNKTTIIPGTTPNGKRVYDGEFMVNEDDMVYGDYEGNLFFYNLIKQDWVTGKISNASENPIRSFSITKNNRYLFTTGNEGNVKLWDIQKLELLATLYPNPNNGDWAVVTPNGQFDASTGAQKEIYFVKEINTFPLEILYEKYFTPSLLTRLLAGERFAPVDFDNLFKAPTIKMVYEQKSRNLTVESDLRTFQNTTGIAEITVTATATEGKIDEIRLFHNGKIVTLTTRNLIVADDNSPNSSTKRYSINLLSGTNSIRAIALNSQRTESNVEEIAITYNPSIGSPVQPIAVKPGDTQISLIDKSATLHLIVVGINTYKNNAMSLNYALADATGFKDELEKKAKSVITNLKTYFIKDAEADKAGITNAFSQVQKSAKEQDVFVFYYAGHGVISNDKMFYLVPNDVSNLKNVQTELVEKGIDAKLLQQYAVDIRAQKQLFILDACQSAGAFENMLSANGDQQKNLAIVARSTGTHWMAASGSKQFANEFSSLGHGAFTYVLLKALQGEAASNKMITVNGLKSYLQVKVPELMKKYNGAEQYPASYGYGNDFPVEILK